MTKLFQMNKPKKSGMIYERSQKSSLKNTCLTEKVESGKARISKKQKEAIAEDIASFFFAFWKNKRYKKKFELS